MKPSILRLDGPSKTLPMVASLGLVAVVGLVDYLTGFELYFFAFYLIPVALAGWFIGRGFAVFVSILSVAASVAGDIIAGARYSSRLVLVWNALIAASFYITVVWILGMLRTLYDELEERVRERTAALNSEMQERMRLEEEILRVSEREQRRIGFDLHDSLCQHLTGTALAVQVLGGQLRAYSPQAGAANHIVELVEEAIELTRKLARGLHPVELNGEGLIDAFRELASVSRERFKIPCVFESDELALFPESRHSIHLYRIAQEAVSNAVKHSKAQKIVIRLESVDDVVNLTISDDGVGIPGNRRKGDGMGLRIMAYRSSMIGASFKIERLPDRGTRVTCAMPVGEGDSPEMYVQKSQNPAD